MKETRWQTPSRLLFGFRRPSSCSWTLPVQMAGERWGERFWKVYNKHSEQKRVCVLSEATDVLDEREYLPAWLRTKPDYDIWQRNNLWTLFNALAEGGARNLTLIALWDGESTGDGHGGTSDLVRKVQERGARRHSQHESVVWSLESTAMPAVSAHLKLLFTRGH